MLLLYYYHYYYDYYDYHYYCSTNLKAILSWKDTDQFQFTWLLHLRSIEQALSNSARNQNTMVNGKHALLSMGLCARWVQQKIGEMN